VENFGCADDIGFHFIVNQASFGQIRKFFGSGGFLAQPLEKSWRSNSTNQVGPGG